MSIKECSITSWFSDIQAEMYPIFIHKGKKNNNNKKSTVFHIKIIS